LASCYSAAARETMCGMLYAVIPILSVCRLQTDMQLYQSLGFTSLHANW